VKRPQRRSISKAKEQKRVFSQFILPLGICVCILVCLSALGYLGYQKVAASDFFNVKRVEVVGVGRASREAIENVARVETERTGVLNSDLFELKSKIEKMPYVKTASVTRVLPGGIRIRIVERQPVALVTRSGREYFADADGEILGMAETREDNLPFAMMGWDEAKSEKAMKENTERVKIYQRMVSDWRASNVLSRVQHINLSDVRAPRAVITDSGTTVSIAVGRENYAENLIKGIKAVVGKGSTFEAVDLVGSNMILAPRKQN
jgi:cell division septal protein FtsQ